MQPGSFWLGSTVLLATVAVNVGASNIGDVRRDVSPLQKVEQLLSDLEMKIRREGELEDKAYAAYEQWCRTGAKDKEFEIKTSQAKISDLTAFIDKAQSDILSLTSKIEDLAASTATNENDLKAATQIREKENKEFQAAEEELTDAVDTLERAINVLQRKLRGSALLQLKVNTSDINQLVHALSVVIDGAALSLHDKQRLLGLVQSREDEDDRAEDEEEALALGAPAPEAYKGHSESIIDVLEDLKQKAVSELEQARREEANARHNFELLKQSLEDQIKVDTKEMSQAKMMKHDSMEGKASSKGDLGVAKNDLADAKEVLSSMDNNCKSKASDREASLKSRAEELKAIADARAALRDVSESAATTLYGSTSFFQLNGSHSDASGFRLHTIEDLAHFEVVNLVRKLAREQDSAGLAQLATQISAAMRDSGNTGEDPFAKVKALISDMIERLIKEAGSEAQHKAYCDKELADTNQKLAELKHDIEKHTAKVDKATSDVAMLKDEIATAQASVAEALRSQAEADKIRKDEHELYLQMKVDFEQGLQGVRMALKILREYYADQGESRAAASSFAQQPADPGTHSASIDSGRGIIGLLEVVESDLGRSLALIVRKSSDQVNERSVK